MQQQKSYRQVPNFNLIPPERQKPTVSVSRLLLRFLFGLVIVIEVILISNAAQEKSTLGVAINLAQQKIRQVENELAQVNAKKDEAQKLATDIDTLKKQRESLESDWRELQTKEANWSQVLVAFLQTKPKGVQLFALNQDGTHIEAAGSAPNYTALLEYRRLLLASPAISQITFLQSEQTGSAVLFSLAIEVKGGKK